MLAQKTDGLEPRVGRSLSIDRAAALLGVSRRTIYNRIRDGHLQTVRTPGGSQRVLVESLPRCDSSAFSVCSESSGARRRNL
jgi:excisionase family DNA binding protein